MKSIFIDNLQLLHGETGWWDEIGMIIGIISFVILMSFLAWSNGNKRRKAQARRRREREEAKDG